MIRSYASTYLARVPATTSSGSSGPGGVWSQPGLVEPVAHVLLVERGLRAAGLPVVRGPEARRVRGQDLVAEHDLGARRGAELELRVGDDDPALGGVVAGVLVELEGHPAQLLHQRPVADDLGGALEVDVLVVVADLGLGRRGEDRLRQPVGLLEAGGQLDPADRAGRRYSFQPEPVM